jgi:hypothetical protein
MGIMRKILLIVVILLTGCGPWTKAGGQYKSTKHNFILDIPQGWYRLNTSKYLFITKDGVPLQNVVVNRISVDEPLEHTKKGLDREMLPQEAAEVIIDNTSSDPALLSFTLLENVPMTIYNRPGFKLLYTYKNRDGLEYKSIYCGFMSGDWLYGIRYSAPSRYYFSKDVGTFEEILNSLQLLKTSCIHPQINDFRIVLSGISMQPLV